MARMEAMIQQLVGAPLAYANGGARNHPGVEPPPRAARDRHHVVDSDDDSDVEVTDAQEKQLQGHNQPEYRIHADIPFFHDWISEVEHFFDFTEVADE
uniref:Uncharacterized protein n=1 Tax=Salix viminalis TaxID=40686 RepID=A0A6N2LI19_SALVM